MLIKYLDYLIYYGIIVISDGSIFMDFVSIPHLHSQ